MGKTCKHSVTILWVTKKTVLFVHRKVIIFFFFFEAIWDDLSQCLHLLVYYFLSIFIILNFLLTGQLFKSTPTLDLFFRNLKSRNINSLQNCLPKYQYILSRSKQSKLCLDYCWFDSKKLIVTLKIWIYTSLGPLR